MSWACVFPLIWLVIGLIGIWQWHKLLKNIGNSSIIDINEEDYQVLQKLYKHTKFYRNVNLNGIENKLLKSIRDNGTRVHIVFTFKEFAPFNECGKLFWVDTNKVNEVLGYHKLSGNYELMGVHSEKSPFEENVYQFIFWRSLRDFEKDYLKVIT